MFSPEQIKNATIKGGVNSKSMEETTEAMIAEALRGNRDNIGGEAR